MNRQRKALINQSASEQAEGYADKRMCECGRSVNEHDYADFRILGCAASNCVEFREAKRKPVEREESMLEQIRRQR